jgi:dipeptidyl aminopeptidase/acylaminoacyl peptidase
MQNKTEVLMNHKLSKALTASLLFLTLSCVAIAQENISGGQSGFDQSLTAISPNNEKINISLAGQSPADISRYILARNNSARGARVSPSGDSVAFQWSITGAPQLWIVPKEGGQAKQLTFGNGISFFRWTPNGDALIYGADNNGNEQEAYYKISPDGLKESLLLSAKDGAFRVFGDFIDNTTIAYSSTERTGLDFDIYTADTIKQSSAITYEGSYFFGVEAVSPNGQYIVISESVGEDSDNLYVFDRQTKTMTTVSKPQRRANHAEAGIQWTPDNKGFFLASNVERNFTALMYYSLENGFTEIESAPADIENVTLCGQSSQYLAYSENRGGYSILKIKNLDTSSTVSVPTIPEGVLTLSCSQRSDEMVMTVNGWQTPGDIYTYNISTETLHHTFSAQLAGIDKNTLIKPISITMPARDGVELQGLLYLPKASELSGDSEGEKPPVLFIVHGGPTAQSRPTFSADAQYYATNGIAVFLPNVRGSTGFGHNYVTLDDRINRLDSIRDLVDMLAYFEVNGPVDANRAAVSGGSYGGYAVNAVLANYPGHFIAGISLFGVADWVTALQIASPGLKASDRIEYGDINEQVWLEFYTKQSPIRQANNIDVPVLYSHGAMDPRIDIVESEIMVKTLRANGIEAPFIRFEDEGHGWRKLNNRLFYAREEAKFLDNIFNKK